MYILLVSLFCWQVLYMLLVVPIFPNCCCFIIDTLYYFEELSPWMLCLHDSGPSVWLWGKETSVEALWGNAFKYGRPLLSNTSENANDLKVFVIVFCFFRSQEISHHDWETQQETRSSCINFLWFDKFELKPLRFLELTESGWVRRTRAGGGRDPQVKQQECTAPQEARWPRSAY